jgi:ketosteroid isomerase-like protein
MRFRSLCAALFFLGSIPGCQRTTVLPAPPPSFDTDEHVAAWIELWNTYDLSRVDELFLDDPRASYLSSEREGLIRGLADIRDHHVGFGFTEGGRDPDQELWVEDVATSVYGSVAVLTARWFFGDRRADRDSLGQGPMTVVYVHDGDRHKIAHMHFANY